MSIPGFAEPFSSLSHLFGAGVFAISGVFLLRRGWGDAWRVASLAVFAGASVFLLAISGVYHLLAPSGGAHVVLQRIDHAAIFALIASSFTPVHMILFRGWGRWGMLFLIWAIAIVAIVLKTIYFESIPAAIGTGMYIGMGWIGLGSWLSLLRRFTFSFIKPIMWSGFSYTVGGILDVLKWPVLVSGVIQSHEVFHVAVLMGLGFHWAFVYSIADRPREGTGEPTPVRHVDPNRRRRYLEAGEMARQVPSSSGHF